MDNRPIGIFDSGMGGLSVRAAIEQALPHESLVYFGDGANVPYGPRSKEEITRFVDEAVVELIERNDVKMIVIACNAATGAAIDYLRAKYNIPIIGMEPAVKPAALTTKTGVVGVLATAAAFKGDLYRTTSAEYRNRVRIIETVGEGFVELVENDRENTPEALETVRRAVEPMLDAGADRIVLGCTHYPFLAQQVSQVIDQWTTAKNAPRPNPNPDTEAEAAAQIVDSAPAIARRVEQLLAENNLHASSDATPHHQFHTFADNDYRARLMRKSTQKIRL
jgi:glutamate racemase